MKENVSEFFGGIIEEYDSLMRRAVPRYDEMIARAVEYMPPGRERILDLGCGTGNLTVAVAERYPEARITIVDGSREMLEITAARLEPERSIECIEARFEELDLPIRAYDLITSSVALHHIEDQAPFFRRLFSALEPGGAIVYADQMRGCTDEHHAIDWKQMHDFWKLPGNLTAQEQETLKEHVKLHDHYSDVYKQLRQLEAAGFTELDCVWRDGMCGIGGARPRADSRRVTAVLHQVLEGGTWIPWNRSSLKSSGHTRAAAQALTVMQHSKSPVQWRAAVLIHV